MGKIVENVICPECGDNVYQEKYLDKQLYVCAHELEPEVIPNGPTLHSVCSHVQAYCKTCDKIYDQSNFGKHGEAYECKECGTVNWPYTDYKNEHDAMLNNIRRATSSLRRALSKFE